MQRRPLGVVALAALLSLSFVSALGVVPIAQAGTAYTVGQSWCSANSGIWVPFPIACFLTSSFTLNSGDTLTIPSGVSLGTGSTFTNDGTTYVSGFFGNGIGNTIDNEGTFVFESGSASTLFGTFNNHGTVTVDSGNSYLQTGGGSNFGTFNNYGTVSNSGTFKDQGVFNEECSGTYSGNALIVTGTYNPAVGCSSVPQFPLGLAFLFAVVIPALLVLRKRTLFRTPGV